MEATQKYYSWQLLSHARKCSSCTVNHCEHKWLNTRLTKLSHREGGSVAQLFFICLFSFPGKWLQPVLRSTLACDHREKLKCRPEWVFHCSEAHLGKGQGCRIPLLPYSLAVHIHSGTSAVSLMVVQVYMHRACCRCPTACTHISSSAQSRNLPPKKTSRILGEPYPCMCIRLTADIPWGRDCLPLYRHTMNVPLATLWVSSDPSSTRASCHH